MATTQQERKEKPDGTRPLTTRHTLSTVELQLMYIYSSNKVRRHGMTIFLPI